MALEWFSQGGQGWYRKHTDISLPHPPSLTQTTEGARRGEKCLDLRNGEFDLGTETGRLNERANSALH